MNLAQQILTLSFRAYKLTVSPVLHALVGPLAGCRFTPTCSEYAAEAVRRHGAGRGGWLAARRVGRCHPWGGCGHDPVPERVEPLRFQPSGSAGAESRCSHHCLLLNK
ncbi:MAG: membrane protein insertion efficiency factor YidD [Verrucomicrobia bacterium]|nr:membrane protein insertion efficiency factor YidD [Verrucomicrobiota bacterium]